MINRRSFIVKISLTVLLIIAFGTLFGFQGTASAPEIRKGPEPLEISKIQVIAGGSADSYPGWITDNDLNTAWKPAATAASGTIEFQLAEPELLYGITVSAALSDGDTIGFSYLWEGQWLPLPVGRKKSAAFASQTTIPLANLRVVTSSVRLTLNTALNSQSKISEVGFIGIQASDVFHKLTPVKIATSNGPDIVSPASYLTDNNTYTTWNANSYRSDMLSSPWDYFDSHRGDRLHKKWTGDDDDSNCYDDDHDHHGGNSDIDAFINLTFNDDSRLKEVRFYPQADSLDAIGIKADTGSGQIPMYQSRGTFQNDWTIIPLNEVDHLKNLSVELDGKNHKNAGIAELECWGYGDYQGITYVPLTDGSAVTLDKSASYVFQDQNTTGSELYILLEGQKTGNLNLNVNSGTFSLSPNRTADGNTYYILPLRSLTDFDAEQSLIINPLVSTTAVLLGVWLRNKPLSGEQEEDAINSATQPGTGHAFNERVLLHDAEIYRPEGAFFNAEGLKGNTWNALGSLDSGDFYSRWQPPSQFNQELDGIRLTGSDSSSLWGMRILGSVESNHAPVVKILYPSPNMEIDEDGHGVFPYAIVTVDNQKADLKINGKSVDKIGKFYVAELSDLGLYKNGSVTIHAAAVDQSGRQGEDTIFVSLSDYLFTVNLPQGINRTDKPNVTVSGTTQTPNVSIKVNGQVVGVNRKSFSATVALIAGVNTITILGKDEKSGKQRTAIRQVFYSATAIALTIDNPVNGQYIQTPTVQVSGTVMGGTSVKVLVNGSQAQAFGNRYISQSITLKEGANTITVQATDNQGHSISKSLTVYRDTTNPIISNIQPANGALLNTGAVQVSLMVSDTSSCWVIVNNVQASKNGSVYSVTLPLSDGQQTLTISAEDQAGNRTTVTRTVIVDTQPPLPFTITVTPSGWTNNPRPVVTFATTDLTSGIDHYELKIDDGAYARVTSPYTVPALTDGTHNIMVKAIDKAGWTQSAQAQAFIDTVPPATPLSFALIPGTGKIIINYAASAADTATYVIERSPAWNDGLKHITALTLTDTGLTGGAYYSYRVKATDRAGNESAFTDWKSVMCGKELETYTPAQATTAEYDGATVMVPAQGLLDGSAAVSISEVQAPGLESQAAFVRVSPIFDLAAVDAVGKPVKPGETLPQSYISAIRYNSSLIPAGLDESDLDVYYYDPLWNCWRRCESVVDKDSKQVYFVSKHFSLYDVQATAAKDLDPDEVKKNGYSPFRTYMQHGSMDVAPDNGGLSNRVTELVLPGPAGFDLTLSRLYSTAYAKVDGLQVTETALLPYLQNKAAFAFTVGKGIRLDLPYIMNTGNDEYLVLPGGAGYSFFEMKMTPSDPTTNSDGSTVYTLKLTPAADSQDFELTVVKYFNKNITINYSSNDNQGQQVPTCGSTSYSLMMKNGAEYDFDSDGKPTKMTDANRLNSITFTYKSNDTQLDYIQDAIGRKVYFDYDVINNLPYIKTITVANDAPYNRTITYTHDTNGYLTSETDAGGRKWSYGYQPYNVPAKQTVIPYNFYAAAAALNYTTVNDIVSKYQNAQVKYFSVPLMNTLRGPGKGIIEAHYGQFSFEMTGFTIVDDISIYTNEDLYSKKSPQRMTQYNYQAQAYEIPPASTVAIPAEKRGYIKTTTSTDGNRESIYTFDAFTKKTASWVIAGYPAAIATDDGTITSTMGDNLYQVCTRNLNTKKTDYAKGATLEEQQYSYDANSTLLRPIQTKIIHGNDWATTDYTYDTYGNVKSIDEKSVSKDRFNRKTTKFVSIDEPNPTDLDANFKSKPYEGTGFQIPTLMLTKHDLPLRQMVINYVPQFTNGLLNADNQGNEIDQAQYQYIYYEYNALGQLIKTATWDSVRNAWLISKMGYDNEANPAPAKAFGNLVYTINAENEETDYTYDVANGFPASRTVRAVKDAGEKTTDVSESYGYETASGWLLWQKNPRGFVTENLYDSLGRVTDIVYPSDVDGTTYHGGGLTRANNPRPNNPKKHMDYGDAIGNLFATETDPVGSKTTRQFDDFGQLIAVINSDKDGKNASSTSLAYDRWGNIASITDPNGNTTSIEYDAMGKKTKITYPDDTPGLADNPFKEISYDYSANVQTAYDELRNKSLTQYDMSGRAISATSYNGSADVNGITKKVYFDGVGNAIATFGPKKNEEAYSTYNSLNLLVSQTSSQETFYENGENGLTTISARPESGCSYDKVGRLTEAYVVGPGGKKMSTLTILDSLGRKIEVQVTASGTVLSDSKIFYDPNGNVIKQIDPNNTPTTLMDPTYSARDKLLSVTDQAGNMTSYTYNPDDTVDRLTGPRGNSGKYKDDFSIHYMYDNLKRLVSADLPPKEPHGARPVVTLTYDKRGNLISRTNSLDNGVTTNAYTARNLIAKQTITDPASGKSISTAYEYDSAGNPVKMTDPRGKITVKKYDGLNRLIGVTLPDGKSTIGYEYDEENNRTAAIDGLGHRTENAYNLYGKLISTQTAEDKKFNKSYRYFFDRLGNLTQTIDTLNNVRSYTYDQLNRLTSEQDEEDGLHQYQYDQMKNIMNSTDPNGTTAAYTYTPDYKLKSLSLINKRTAQSKTVNYNYDEEGFVTQVSDDGVITSYNNSDPVTGNGSQPDAYNRIKKEVTSLCGKSFTMGYAYDVMDRMTGITYPNNNTVGYQYDALGEVTQMPGYVQPDSLAYDHGFVTSMTAGNGVRTDYTYDDNSRLSTLKHTGKDGDIKSYTLTYDLAGNIQQKNQDIFKYDGDNRLTEADLTGSFSVDAAKEQQTVGAVQEDVIGDRQLDFNLEEAVDDPTILSLDYNASSIGVDLGDTYDLKRIELTPLTAGNRVTPPNIRIFVSDDNNPGSYSEKKGFAAAYVKKGDATVLNIGFTEKVRARYIKVKTDYNERDLATFQALDLSQFKNSPDKIIKVYYNVPTRTEKYTYDAMGNRQTESITLDKNHLYTDQYYPNTSRLMTNGRWAYVYDANGNIVGKADTILVRGTPTRVDKVTADEWSAVSGSTTGLTLTGLDNGIYWQYTYDLMNRMIKAVKNGTEIAAYTYNWKGYRVKKEKLSAKAEETKVTYYIFTPNGKLMYEEEEKTGSQTANFYRQYDYLFNKLFAKDVGHIDDSEKISGASRFYYHTDHLGSVTAITDEAGNTAWSDEFTPFGSAADSTSTPDGGLKFASYTYDEDVGLNYALARWQDPETGRFTSLDPIKAGMNWYTYCGNNPMSFIDPTGLDPDGTNYGYSDYFGGDVGNFYMQNSGGIDEGGGGGGGGGRYGDHWSDINDAINGNDWYSQNLDNAGNENVFDSMLNSHRYSESLDHNTWGYQQQQAREESAAQFLGRFENFMENYQSPDSDCGAPAGIMYGHPMTTRSESDLSQIMSEYDRPTLGPGGTYGIEGGLNTITSAGVMIALGIYDYNYSQSKSVSRSVEKNKNSNTNRQTAIYEDNYERQATNRTEIWTATFMGVNAGFFFGYDKGSNSYGLVAVKFHCIDTERNFLATYSFSADKSGGLFAFFGMSTGFGVVASYFPAGQDISDIAESFRGPFLETFISGGPWTGSYTRGGTSLFGQGWTGGTISFGPSAGGGIGAITYNYKLVGKPIDQGYGD